MKAYNNLFSTDEIKVHKDRKEIMNLTLDNGTWQVLCYDNGLSEVYRFGELWKDITIDGFTQHLLELIKDSTDKVIDQKDEIATLKEENYTLTTRIDFLKDCITEYQTQIDRVNMNFPSELRKLDVVTVSKILRKVYDGVKS